MNSDHTQGPEFLGAQRVLRSAHAVKSATKTFIYLGVCERDNRPVRFEFPVDMGKIAEVPCFAGCTLPVKCERLYAVSTELTCDGSCRGARSPYCSCGCGGINHGKTWGQGALLDSRLVVEAEIARYRAEMVKLAEQREQRAEAKVRAARNVFGTWSADHADLIRRLGPWHEHRTDYDWQPKHWGARILVDFAIQTHGGWNGKPKPLTEKQIILAERILREIAADARAKAEREAARAAKPGAGDQAALVPGVYKLDGEIYVVKGNMTYKSWRKQCREHGECARPADARLYAKRLAESAPRITESGTEIPFDLVYARGVIFDLAITDRMPLAEAEELSTRYAKCIVCERTLKAAKSVRASIGPVCIKMFGPVLPEANAA